MRRPLRPSSSHRPDERPPPGGVTVAAVAAVAVAALLALSPALVLSAAFTGAVCAVAVRECR